MKKQLNKKELNSTSGGGKPEDLLLVLAILDGAIGAAELIQNIEKVEKLRKEGNNAEASKIINDTYEKVDSLNNADLSRYIRRVLK